MQRYTKKFWSKVRKTDDQGCWLWTGARDVHPIKKFPTYGSFSIGSSTDQPYRHVKAHRFAWELAFGPIPAGIKVLHRCDIPNCVRPEHLFLGTQADNVADMMNKGRGVQLGGTRHGNAKFTEEQVKDIRRRFVKGARKGNGAAGVIAREYGVDRHTVSRMATGRRYR